MEKSFKSEWYCVQCSAVLGKVFGNEFVPDVPGANLRTSGPNLVVTCPECGATKVWYTSDPVVRAVYQLVNTLSAVAAKAMVEEIGAEIHKHQK
jgi:hypothetical protein